MWYAPELLKALTKEDFHTRVAFDKDDHEEKHPPECCEVVIDEEVVWKPFHAYTGNFPYITVQVMLESFTWNAEGGSGPLNGLHRYEIYEMGYWDSDLDGYNNPHFRDLRECRSIFNFDVDEMLRNDDLDGLREWCYLNEVTGEEVGATYYTTRVDMYCPIDLFQMWMGRIGLLDVAFYFKATKIINFLLLNGYKTTENSLVVAVAIGAPELIRLSLQHMKYRKDETVAMMVRKLCYHSWVLKVAKTYDRTEILSWLEDINDGIIDSI
jgi:hypothetical protein